MADPWRRREQIGDCTLYLGDCLEVMPTLGKVDAVVTDPPYGVNFSYDGYDDNPETHQTFVDQFLPILMSSASGPVCIFPGIRGVWYYPKAHWMLSWRKTFSVSRSPFGSNNWEPVLVYNKGKRGERASDSFEATFMHDKLAAGHPCPKPVKAMAEVMLLASLPNETILDPFMGSGTTGVACVNLGRKFIGIELEPKYFDIACKRIEEAYRQPRLFAEPVKAPEQVSLLTD